MNSKGGEERPAVGDDEPVAAGMDDDEQFDCETLFGLKWTSTMQGFMFKMSRILERLSRLV